MGEAFLGIPNRFVIIDNANDVIYNPHHVLSARMGYTLNEKFKSYLSLTGGTLRGSLSSMGILPIADSHYQIGDPDHRYNSIYSRTFYGSLDGNASTATKLQSARTLKLIGSVTGAVQFDCSGDITLDCSTNHNHNDLYLSLTGGTLTGNLVLGHNSTLVGHNNQILLSLTSNHILELHKGSYDDKKGNVTIYSHGDFDVKTNSSGMSLTSSLFKKTINIGTSEDSVYFTNTKSHNYLHIRDTGDLTFDDNIVYHRGNFNPDDYIQTTYKSHIEDIKKVTKVLAILLDKLEVSSGIKDQRDYPEFDITDELEYYKSHAMEILDQ